MSVHRIAMSKKTREKVETHAARESKTVEAWLCDWIEKSVEEPLPEERWIEQKLLEALNDPRPPIVPDEAFWKNLLEEALVEAEVQKERRAAIEAE